MILLGRQTGKLGLVGVNSELAFGRKELLHSYKLSLQNYFVWKFWEFKESGRITLLAMGYEMMRVAERG